MEVFTGSFTQQEPIPQAGIDAAIAVMQSGRLHRYNTVKGEDGETALLEQEFAQYLGAKYCLAVASGGYALGAALRALNVRPGEVVLTNAFTLAPVPGAIAAIGARPVFVETTDQLTIDFHHLEKMAVTSGARVLMLSHMRGHLADMPALMALCDRLGLKVVEDCAHTMGAEWDGVPSGRFGAIACFSTQTYKHMNSGEGGLITTDDPYLAARCILLSGSYMLYGRHLAAPTEAHFEELRLDIPNVSGRMDNLRAAVLRPQIQMLAERRERWTELHGCLETGLAHTPGLKLIHRPVEERHVASSFQFLLPDWKSDRITAFLSACAKRGVELKWFGADQPVAFTSRYDHWRYAEAQVLPQTDRVLAGLIDMRLPLTFSVADVAQIARIIRAEVLRIGQAAEIESVALPKAD